jgi:hypothetical protein
VVTGGTTFWPTPAIWPTILMVMKSMICAPNAIGRPLMVTSPTDDGELPAAGAFRQQQLSRVTRKILRTRPSGCHFRAVRVARDFFTISCESAELIIKARLN